MSICTILKGFSMITLSKSQSKFISQLHLKHINYGFVQGFENKDSSLLFCDIPGKYTLIYGDYKIQHDFSVEFETNDSLLRFGVVNEGRSEFKIKNKKMNHFLPSAFIALENNLSGCQNLRKGHHYQGLEMFIQSSYVKKLSSAYPELSILEKLPYNHAILFLPTKIIHIFNYLECQIKNKKMSPLLLQAKVLECLSLISTELKALDQESFLEMLQLKSIGSTDDLQLSTTDLQAIQRCHDILTRQLKYPPSVKELSEQLLIGEQKLTTGFKELYHTTIGKFVKDQKLQVAANLLTTSDMSIDEISTEVGYSHPSNLGKAFKSKYLRTPLQYRKFNQRK